MGVIFQIEIEVSGENDWGASSDQQWLVKWLVQPAMMALLRPALEGAGAVARPARRLGGRV